MNRFLLFIIICCLGLFQAFGQEIVFDGRISDFESGGSLDGVSIIAKANGSQVASTTTRSNGKYDLNIPIGKVYIIEYSKPGYVTKIMKIHTEEISEEDLPIGGRVMPAVDIDLFTTKESVDFSFMKVEPVVDWAWDNKKLRMDWDKKVYNKMKKKIDDLLQEAADKEQENLAKYNELISEADKLFSAKDYEASLVKYEEAVKIPGKEQERHPNDRIFELDELLKAKAKEELIKKQSEEKYQNVITAAEALKLNKEYDKAIAKFNEALGLKPDEVYPLDQIKELEVLLKEQESKKEYNLLVEKADGFLEANSLNKAKEKYEEASQLFTDEAYPIKQLKIIEDKFKEAEEEKRKQQKYDAAINEADTYFAAADYENAKQKYEEAVGYDDTADHPKNQLNLIDEKLAEIAAAIAKEAAYDSLIVIADEALANSQYDAAVSQYEAALAIKSGDSYATTQKEKAKSELEAIENAAAMKAKISELLINAETHFQSEDYESAINEFEAVLELDANNKQAVEGKEKSQNALADVKARAALQNSFDEKVAEGDRLFSENNMEEALKTYEAANKIIPDDVHVLSQLEKIETSLREAKELEAKINNLLVSANNELNSEKWQNAINQFEEVLSLDESNEDAIKGKETAQEELKALEEQQNIEAQFNMLKDEASQLFQQEEWRAAKEKYEEAITIKEDEGVAAKIKEIETKLAQLAAEETAEETAEENYKAAMETGNQAVSNESYDNAINAFKEALAVRENDNLATEKLNEAIALKKQHEAFEQLKNEGADLVAAKSWDEAKKKYQEAKAIKEDEAVISQLKLIETELNKLASKEELEEQYQSFIKEGESYEAAAEYDKAIEKYEEALGIKNDDAFASEKIADLKDKLLSIKKEKEIEAAYQEKMNVGKEALSKADYAEAIEAFDDALELKPGDSEAEQQKNKAKGLLSELASEEEAYQELLTAAKMKMEAGELEEAKTMFKNAQSQRPKDAIPQSAIVKIDEMLRNREESEDLEMRYNEKIQEADKMAEDLKYQEAITLFKDAGKIKPDEEYPKERVREIQGLLDQIAANSKESEAYNDKIKQADLAFDDNNFAESIDLYKEALLIDEEATYPNDQIAKAEAKLESLKENKLDEEFQLLMKKGNESLANEEYAKAIDSYDEALILKSNSQEAKDRKAEARALLDAVLANESADKEMQERFDKIITAADKLFDNREYVDAKDKYEEALKVIKGNQYAIDRIEESVALAQEKVKNGDDLRYNKIVDKADEYFEAENYDKATSLYQRALGLRNQDPYPSNQLEEIERILAGDIKVEQGLEYLGESEEISVMEGAALLEEAETQRQNMKTQSAVNQLKKHEAIFLAKNQDDFDERIDVQNEFVRIHDLRVEGLDKENKMKQEFSADLDAQLFSIAKQRNQSNRYEYASIIKQNQTFDYNQDDFRNIHKEKSAEHLAIADKIYDVRVDYDEMQNKKSVNAVQEWQASAVKFSNYSDKQYVDFQRAIELRKVNEEFILDQTYFQEEQRQVSNADNNNKILSIQSGVEGVDQKIAAKHADKIQIQAAVEKDIQALRESVTDKNNAASQELTQKWLEQDELIASAYDQYLETMEGSDAGRIQTIADIKSTNETIVAQKQVKDQHKIETTRGIEAVVLDVNKMNEEQLRKMNDEAVETFKKMDEVDNKLKRQSEINSNEENSSHQEIMDKVDKINIEQNQLHADRVKVQAAIEKDIQALRESVTDKNNAASQELTKKWLEQDELIASAYDQYLETMEDSDAGRIQTIADIKSTNETIVAQKQVKDQHKIETTRGIEAVVLDVNKMNEEQLRKMNDEAVETFEKMDEVDNKLKRQSEINSNEENKSHQKVMDEVDKTNILQGKLHTDEKSKIKENNELIDKMNVTTEQRMQEQAQNQDGRRIANQQKIDEESQKEQADKPIIANTLGDEFPEGVSQETYVTKDKDGFPVKVITRRIVVTEGRGVEYRRIQTRNGVTYSKNGISITENIWYKDTMNAKLDKHF